jgi:hypothetical protein
MRSPTGRRSSSSSSSKSESLEETEETDGNLGRTRPVTFVSGASRFDDGANSYARAGHPRRIRLKTYLDPF